MLTSIFDWIVPHDNHMRSTAEALTYGDFLLHEMVFQTKGRTHMGIAQSVEEGIHKFTVTAMGFTFEGSIAYDPIKMNIIYTGRRDRLSFMASATVQQKLIEQDRILANEKLVA